MLLILSFLGSFGNGLGLLRTPVDLILIALGSIAVFYWAKYTALPKAVIDYDEKKKKPFKYENPAVWTAGYSHVFITVAEDL